jgi:two-component system, NarL family, response regulator DegU
METLKLAVVDDHTLFRQGLIQILKKNSSYEISIDAASGEDFINSLVEDNLPDIVLLDLNMKGMSGQDVCNVLKNDFPQIKIIILSMNYSHEYIRELIKMGANGYLPKDIDQQKLVEAITQVYTKGHYMDDEIAEALREGLHIKEVKNLKKSHFIEKENINFTEREMEVLKLICKGLNNNQIGDELFISYRTVEGHRKNLLQKSGVSNSVSLVMFAVKHGLIEIDE